MDLSVTDLEERRDWGYSIASYPYTYLTYNYNTGMDWRVSWAKTDYTVVDRQVIQVDPTPGSTPGFTLIPEGEQDEQLLSNTALAGDNGGFHLPTNWSLDYNTGEYKWDSYTDHGSNRMDTHHSGQHGETAESMGGTNCIYDFQDDKNSDHNGANAGCRSWRYRGSATWRRYWEDNCMQTPQSGAKSGSDWYMDNTLQVNGYAYTQGSGDCETMARVEYDVTRHVKYRFYQSFSNSWFLDRHVDNLTAAAQVVIQTWESKPDGGTTTIEGNVWIELGDNNGHKRTTSPVHFTAGQVINLADNSLADLVETYKGSASTWTFSIVVEYTFHNHGDKQTQVTNGNDVTAYMRLGRTGRAIVKSGTPSVKMTYSKTIPTGIGARTYTDQISWQNRVINYNESTRPYMTADYSVDAITDSDGYCNELSGASLGFYMMNNAGQERVVWSADYSIENTHGTSGQMAIQLGPSDISWLSGTAGGANIRIGVGIYVSGEFRMWREFPTRDTYRVTFSNIHFTMRTAPLPEQIGMGWTDYPDQVKPKAIQSGDGVHDGTGESTRVPTDFGNDPDHDGVYKYVFYHTSVNLTFSYNITVHVKLAAAERTMTTTYVVGYDQGDETTAFFTSHKKVPDPSVSDITSDYTENANFNVTLPKYRVPGSGEWYWNMTEAVVSGYHFYRFPLDDALGRYDPSWTDHDKSVGRWTGGTGNLAECQVLFFEKELLSRPTSNLWDITIDFAAPNEINTSALKISNDPTFTTTTSTFLTDEYLDMWYDLDTQIAYSASENISTFHIELYNSSADSIYHNSKVLTGGVATDFQFVDQGATHDTWKVNATSGQGTGFTATGYYIGTMSSSSNPFPDHDFSGVFRVGFVKDSFELNRRTNATLFINGTPWYAISPTYLWDTNEHAGDGALINVSVVWEDLSDISNPRLISVDDGFGAISARMVVTEWQSYEQQKRGVDYEDKGWVSGNSGGTVMIGETWKEHDGVFTAYVDPMSADNPSGNMTQGFHNFTVTLSRDGFQDQTLSSNFSVVLDTFLEVTMPVHQTGTGSNNTYPHFYEDGAQAAKAFEIHATVRHRGSYFGQFGDLFRLAGGSGGYFEDKVHVNYTLIKIGHINPLEDANWGELYWDYGSPSPGDETPRSEADWSLVNTSWCEQGWGFNYHNGSFHPIDSSGLKYYVNITTPPYEFNSRGYGKGSVNGDEEMVLYYNYTYWVDTNYTIEYDPSSGLVKNTFQPVTVGSYRTGKVGDTPINGSCERPKDSDFPNTPTGAGSPDYDGNWDSSIPYNGRKREEWTRIYLHTEGSGNKTMLSLYNASYVRYQNGNDWVEEDPLWYTTNASDCGWAFNQTGSVYDIRDPFKGFTPTGYKDPNDPTYTVTQYWMNLTTYSYTQEYFPGSDTSSPGVEQRLNNQTQMVRFRLVYNSTWSDYAEENYAYYDEPMWSDDGAASGGFNPRGGPLASYPQYEFDEGAELTLYNWNGSAIPLTPDPTCNFTFRVKNFTYWSGPPYNVPGNEYVTVTGDTWVTPWLNLTEKAAGLYTGDNALLFEAKKRGFYPAHMRVNLNILPQRTELRNATLNNGSTLVNQDGQSVNDLNFHMRWNTTFSFQVNYTDVTNNLTAGPEQIVGASLSIPNPQGDSTGAKYFYNNEGGQYWSFTPGTPGIYQINILNTAFENLTTEDTKTVDLVFRISKQNYTAIDFNVTLVIEKREMKIVFVNASTLSGYYLDPTKYAPDVVDLTNPYYQEITVTVELWDANDGNKPVSLSHYLGAGDSLDDFFTFGGLNVSPVVEFQSNGRYRYNFSVHTGLSLGWHTLQLSVVSPPTPNYYTVLNTTGLLVEEIPTLFENLTTTEIGYSYIQSYQHLYDDNYAWFNFRVLDLHHSTMLGSFINDSTSRILTSEVSTNWTNPFVWGSSSHWTLNSTGDDDPGLRDEGGYQNVKIYDYIYTLKFNLTGVSARVEPYHVRVVITKANYQVVEVILSFKINNATTKMYSAYLNNELIVDENSQLRYGPTDEIEVPWNQALVVKIGWGYLDYNNRKWAIYDEPVDPAHLFISNWYPGKNNTWQMTTFSQEYNYYSVTLYTDITGNLPENRLVTFSLVKGNFTTQQISLNLTIRERKVKLRLIEDIDTTKETLDLAYVLKYGVNFTMGFELQDDEQATSIIDPVSGSKSLDDVILLDHVADEYFQVPGAGTLLVANYTKVVKNEIDGYHYYFLLTLGTSSLNVKDEPYLVTVNCTKTHYAFTDVTFNITIRQQSIDLTATIISDSGGQVVNVFEDKTFNLVVVLENPDTGERLASDEFIVTYRFLQIDENGTFTEVSWANASGTLEWNAEGKYYFKELYITDDMRGAFRVEFTITSKTGNYETVTASVVLLFQEPPTVISAQSLIMLAVSILLVAGVGSYVGVKAWQLRIPFVLRMIDESIKKINDNKYPSVGVMKSRREFVMGSVVDRLDEVGIEWDVTEKFSIEDIKAGGDEAKPPMNEEEIRAELEKMVSLTEDERALFVEELKRLKRKEQEEFLDSIREG
ncbi:MAG: hypothetical protein ACTSU5_12980 [Promethearchaeota archaeon]